MLEPRRFALPELVLLLLILGVAAGVRAWYLHDCAESGRSAGPVQVQDDRHTELETQARNLKEHQDFASAAPLAAGVESTAHTAPGYSWCLYLVAQLPLNVAPTVRWLQCLLGASTAGLYFLFSLRAFRSRLVAGLTGFLGAVHPFWVASTAEIGDGVLATFLLAACLHLGTRARQTRGPFTSLLFGLALAGLALTRAALLPFTFVALFWFLLVCRGLPRGWLLAVLAFLGFINGLLPWTVRNYQISGDIVPVVDSTFYHLWLGNNPSATGGPLDEKAQLDALNEQQGPELAREELAKLPQQRRYQRLARPVMAEVRGNSSGTARRRLWAGLCFWFGERWLTDSAVGHEPFAEADWGGLYLPTLLGGALLGMSLLSLLGWRWSYLWRRDAVLASLALIWVPLPYLLSHGETLSGPRLPLDGVLLCYAAFAVAALLPGTGTALREGPATEDIHGQPAR